MDKTKEKKMAEAVLRPLDEKANRNAKDSVFCDLFSEPRYVQELYQALHPEDDLSGLDEITLVTLEHAMIRGQYNDLGFIIENRLLVLVEAQSLFTENILVRFLSYLGDTYYRYIKNNKLRVYDKTKIKIPEPELYVIYHGDRGDKPDELYLSKEFFGKEKPGEAFLELKAKVLYGGNQGDIISQYVTYCRVYDEQVRLYGKTKKAVEETIRICKDRNVLREYLSREEAAIRMFEMFDQETAMEQWSEDLKAEGALATLFRLVKDGLITESVAAKQANMTEAEFSRRLALA